MITESVNAGTLLDDEMEYSLPGWRLNALADSLAYASEVLRELLTLCAVMPVILLVLAALALLLPSPPAFTTVLCWTALSVTGLCAVLASLVYAGQRQLSRFLA